MTSSGELLDANINRSPNAYVNNPSEERDRYTHDTDKEMTLLRLEDSNGKERGAVSWFAVHCTSMNNTNRLISGDNKGVASRLMEDWKNGRRSGAGERTGELASTSKSEVGEWESSRRMEGGAESSEKVSMTKIREELATAESEHVTRDLGFEGGASNRRRLSREHCEGGTCTKKRGFVAAFAQSNVGDTSPNVLGAFCIDTGEPCAANTRCVRF